MATIWARNWVCVGRLADFAVGMMRPVMVGGASMIVARAADGACQRVSQLLPASWGGALCRGRGSGRQADQLPLSRLGLCGCGWATGLDRACRADRGFDRSAHGLRPVSLRVWNGFLFLNLSADPGAIWSDVGLHSMDNWPMDSLITGHVWKTEMRLQLEDLLGKLLGMSALPRASTPNFAIWCLCTAGVSCRARSAGMDAGRPRDSADEGGAKPGRWTGSPAGRSLIP